MKRLLFTLPAVLLSIIASAQLQFGYLSYDAILHEMPDYAQAQQEMATLKAKYEAEAAKGEEDFQAKFVDFLQGQKDFPKAIMQKRQAELQHLMDNGVAFRLDAQSLLAAAEEELVRPVRDRLCAAIVAVGSEYGYAYILNTDGDACPFINPTLGVNVTELVRQKLGLAIAPQQQPVEQQQQLQQQAQQQSQQLPAEAQPQ